MAFVAVVFVARSSRQRLTFRPNILLITLDTTRADHVGAYGYAGARTPALDRLAAEGVLFERAITSAPITLPAHVSVLTGRYPFAHGVRNNGNFKLAESVPTLAVVLKNHGYDTAAFVSAFVLNRQTGLDRGFDLYDDRLDSGGGRTARDEIERRGDRTAEAAVQWLTAHADRTRSSAAVAPFFVWVHLYDAHDPYTPPPPFADLFRDRPYDGEIAFDDEVVGSLVNRLDQLDLTRSTIVAIAGDHGESLGEHGEATHAMFVYESVLRIPLLIRWPQHVPAHVRVGALARGVDVAPTLLALAGAPPMPAADGGVLPVVATNGSEAAPASAAYAETYFPLFFMNWAPLRSIQDDRWKYIEAPTAELYDLASDPGERHNIAASQPQRAAALHRALDALSAGAAVMTTTRPDHDAVEKLAALGYVAASWDAPPDITRGGRADPKDRIDVFNRLRAANQDVRAGRAPAAEATARVVLADETNNAFATLILATALRREARWREAIDAYERYVALVPTSADAHRFIAVAAAQLGDTDRGLREADAAIAIDPRDADARTLRAGFLAERGRLGEADAEYRRAIAVDPDNADAHSGYAVVLDANGQRQQAADEFAAALRLRPDLYEVRLALGGVLDRLGRREQARGEYQRLATDGAVPEPIRRTARERLLTR